MGGACVFFYGAYCLQGTLLFAVCFWLFFVSL